MDKHSKVTLTIIYIGIYLVFCAIAPISELITNKTWQAWMAWTLFCAWSIFDVWRK